MRNIQIPFRSALLALLFAGGPVISTASAAEEIQEMLSVEGWFISAEEDKTGTFSHCQMMNPYFAGEHAILLTFTLSRDHKALMVVVDPTVPLTKKANTAKVETAPPSATANPALARQGRYAFDGGAERTVPAAFTTTVSRLEIPQWAGFRPDVIKAKQIRITGPDRERTFNLYGIDQAIPALENCAKRGGLPPPTPTQKPVDRSAAVDSASPNQAAPAPAPTTQPAVSAPVGTPTKAATPVMRPAAAAPSQAASPQTRRAIVPANVPATSRSPSTTPRPAGSQPTQGKPTIPAAPSAAQGTSDTAPATPPSASSASERSGTIERAESSNRPPGQRRRGLVP